MSKTVTSPAGPRMSDEAVQTRTGKTWKQWFAILDKAGAKKMNHQEIVRYLKSEHAVGPWWQQMVTVTYEQQRGLREKHERASGYEISVSRTLDVGVSRVYKAFSDERLRKAWLGQDGLAVRKATTNKSMRVTWKDGETSLEIYFLPKGADKSQVVVQHSKLPNFSAAAKMKAFWGKTLDKLKQMLET
ncbi:MAG TPA: DUF4287 domain-containing protein [Pyrinomonadaceae bacterium]|nr:DUF4287 domain-containing protein [Pyrinomonadaceae bacterium]